MRGSNLAGYSAFRAFGNRVFNVLFSLVCRRALKDLGSGLNVFAVPVLRDRYYLKCPDDLRFNYCLTLAIVAKNLDYHFFPISWREEDQASNVRLFRQAAETLGLLWQFGLSRRRFMAEDRSSSPGRAYTSQVIHHAEPLG